MKELTPPTVPRIHADLTCAGPFSLPRFPEVLMNMRYGMSKTWFTIVLIAFFGIIWWSLQ